MTSRLLFPVIAMMAGCFALTGPGDLAEVDSSADATSVDSGVETLDSFPEDSSTPQSDDGQTGDETTPGDAMACVLPFPDGARIECGGLICTVIWGADCRGTCIDVYPDGLHPWEGTGSAEGIEWLCELL